MSCNAHGGAMSCRAHGGGAMSCNAHGMPVPVPTGVRR